MHRIVGIAFPCVTIQKEHHFLTTQNPISQRKLNHVKVNHRLQPITGNDRKQET